MIIDVIIPAFNEEESIGLVLADIPGEVRQVVVVDNNSTDQTGAKAEAAGARVVKEQRQGYGSACLKGIATVSSTSPRPDVVVFIDADYSDHPNELPNLIRGITNGADMVIGSRSTGKREQGAMMPQQVFGNWLATFMMKRLYGSTFTDLGPFRAIRYDKLIELEMCDQDYGWTVEMQVKALKKEYNCVEVPANYRKRIGVSKITGTVRGTVMAGYKIIKTILTYR